MLYSEFKGLKLSRLGFGAMRLPVTADGKVDEELTRKMVDAAFEGGVNYFDTAWPYHDGMSEVVLGRCLAGHPRESFFLADKYPGHQPMERQDCEGIFNKQLAKCGVEYFDFYLLHNVMAYSIDTYMNPEEGIVAYFAEQRRLGRIRHLGFSAHATPDELERFLDSPFGKEMEFCQIQLNYVDWELQDAKRKCEILAAHNLPIWVMEPVRGGKLASFPDGLTAQLRSFRPDESTAAWAFRWLQTVPQVTMILSGMSNYEQVQDNLKTFSESKPLSSEELKLVDRLAASLQDNIPCTACRYCTSQCKMDLDIPKLISCCNDYRVQPSFTPTMAIESLPEDKQPSSCLGCGACTFVCPQSIDIPAVMRELAERYAAAPKWKDICRQREEAARRNGF